MSYLDSPVQLVVLLAVLAVVPFAAVGLTSYLKLSVVFAILRNALGAGQVPSPILSSLLAIALSLHIMSPVIKEAEVVLSESSAVANKERGKGSIGELIRTLQKLEKPLSAFMREQSQVRERQFFAELKSPPSAERKVDSTDWQAQETFFTLVPAFMISQLTEAFLIGFMIYLPFLVIDLVVANILMSMGMVMVSPAIISLPFKILLFAGCDGWFLISRGLVLGFGGAA